MLETVRPIEQPGNPEKRSQPTATRLYLFTIVLLFANLATLWLVSNTIFPAGEHEFPSRATAIWRVGVAEIGEKPHLVPNYPESPVGFCSNISLADQRAITDGVALLRGTADGARLYDVLDREGVCIGVADLDFNSAYSRSRWSSSAGWSESEIIIGQKFVDWLYPDIIAAILAHEATHIERAVDGTACYFADACTTLANGVELEEEIVAHQAEAEWWLAAYGRDGKARAFTDDISENRLKAAYLQGPDAFRIFVREMRSDKREGEGI